MLETYCNTKRNYIYIYYISSNVPRYTQDSIKTSISSFGVFTGLSRNTMAHPPVDLLSSTLLTLQPSMNQFIFAASQLLTVTHSTKSSLPGKTQTMHNHIQPSLPLFLSQPPQSIPVPPPLNPLPPFSPTVGQVVPTYSYITQQAPPLSSLSLISRHLHKTPLGLGFAIFNLIDREADMSVFGAATPIILHLSVETHLCAFLIID
jgi:hypothetical protein